MTATERAAFAAVEAIVELVYGAEDLTTSDMQSAAAAIVANIMRNVREAVATDARNEVQ